jgi:DNA-binding response OmpR family regulator
VTIAGTGPIRQPKILVVDDDLALLRMLDKIMSKIGEVTCATDGQEALDLLLEGVMPDIIITDLMMPRIDGLQLVEQLQGNPKLKHIPVIMLTAKGTPRDVITGINKGARHYVVKPFKTQDLIKKVATLLNRKDLIYT